MSLTRLDDHTKELQAITSFLKNEFKKEMKKKVTKAESDYKESLLELRQEFELYKLNSLASTSSNHSHAGAEGGITTEFRDKTKGNSNIAIIASFPVGNSADSGSVKSAGIQFPEVSQYDFPSVIKPKAFEEKKKETGNGSVIDCDV